MKYFLSILLTVNVAWGQCVKPVTLLQQGDAAPCKGYLFTPEQEQKAYENKILAEELVPKLHKKINILEDYNKYLENYNEKWKHYSNQLEHKSRMTDLEKVCWFIGGSVITAIIAKEVL